MIVFLIPASDKLDVARVRLDMSAGELSALQQAVGGYVESVPRSLLKLSSKLAQRTCLLINEEGNAQINRRASRLTGQPIHGDAIITVDCGASWGSVSASLALAIADELGWSFLDEAPDA